MDNTVRKICFSCGNEILENDSVVKCTNCGKLYHKECWEKTHGCINENCRQNYNGEMDNEIAKSFYCPQCGTLLTEEQNFCSKCGTKLEAKLSDYHDTSKKNTTKKSKLLPIEVLILVFIIGLGGYFTYQYYITQNEIKTIEKLLFDKSYSKAAERCNAFLEKRKNEKIEKLLAEAKKGMKQEYIKNANLFGYAVLESAATLEKIGNKIVDNWHSYIFDTFSPYYSIDNAVSSALKEESEDVSKVKEEKAKIDNYYSTLKDLPYKDSELIEIKNDIKDLYSAYFDFYNIVLNPNGSYVSFSEEFQNRDEAVLKSFNELNVLLK